MRASTFPVSSPAVTEQSELTHTAGRMSNGTAAPAASRTAAIVTGSSWIEAVLSTTSRHF